MKKIFITVIILVLGISCKKQWLEIIPQGFIVASKLEDYKKLMNDPRLYFADLGGWSETMILGDDVGAETPFFVNTSPGREKLFQWADTIYGPNDFFGAVALTEGHARFMFHCNKVINEVMNATTGTEAEKKAVLAEALATRAWTLFNISNMYCQPYKESTAATDLGMPITTTADPAQTEFSRGTLKETYDFIIKDFKEALQYIPAKQSFVTRMSKPAIEGLLGKVYVYMGRFDEALPFLNASLASVMTNGQTRLHDYNETLAPGGSFGPIDPFLGPVNAPGQRFNDLTESIVSKIFNSGPGYNGPWGNDGLILDPKSQALYGASDLRLLFYTDLNPDNSPNAGGRLRKYSVTYSRYGLQLSELYLLIAECKAKLNDLAGAVEAVETLRNNRMPPADATVPPNVAASEVELVKFIYDERIREFAMEGMRWFDMRRQSVDPIFTGIAFTHTMFNEDGSTTNFTLRQPQRLTLKWPRSITNVTPDLPDNP